MVFLWKLCHCSSWHCLTLLTMSLVEIKCLRQQDVMNFQERKKQCKDCFLIILQHSPCSCNSIKIVCLNVIWNVYLLLTAILNTSSPFSKNKVLLWKRVICSPYLLPVREPDSQLSVSYLAEGIFLKLDRLGMD